MKRALVLVVCVMCLIGCTHTVTGKIMNIKIDRKPKCKVTVKMDSKLVFQGTADKPCLKD